MSEPMRVSGMFSPMVIQMVAIGEESGKTDELLLSVADYYDEQSDFIIQNMTTLIEPIFIVMLAGMVLVMALAIFLPMWNLSNAIKA
jgi:MSHA biogenesis protein MshG